MATRTDTKQHSAGPFFTKTVPALPDVQFTPDTTAAMKRTAKALEDLQARMLEELPALASCFSSPVMWDVSTKAGLLRELVYNAGRSSDLLRDYLVAFCAKTKAPAAGKRRARQ